MERDLSEWKYNLEGITKEIRGYKLICTEVLKMHEDILISLKSKQLQAIQFQNDIKKHAEEYTKKKEELQTLAKSRRSLAIGFALVPIVNVIATPYFTKGAERAESEADAFGSFQELSLMANSFLKEKLISVLTTLVEDVGLVASFFHVIERQLCKFQKQDERARQHAIYDHYKMMQGKVNPFQDSCRMLLNLLPKVMSEFNTIPIQGADEFYLDTWLEKRSKKETRNTEERKGLLLLNDQNDNAHASTGDNKEAKSP